MSAQTTPTDSVAALIARLDEMPETTDRQPLYASEPDGFLESDQDWVRSNEDAVRWFADNHRAIRAALEARRQTP